MKPPAQIKKDHGYTKVCPQCFARYGLHKFGPRELTMVTCEPCIKDPKRKNKNYRERPEKFEYAEA